MEKVLLILESDILQKSLTEALIHYEVYACQAEQAMDFLTRFQPDALILDLFLPGTDGFTLMESCRDLLPPVILPLSVLDNDYVRQKAAQLGADFVIQNRDSQEIFFVFSRI